MISLFEEKNVSFSRYLDSCDPYEYHHKHCHIMQVTLTYFFLNTKSTIKMKFGSNISVLYDKYFQHVFDSMLETGN